MSDEQADIDYIDALNARKYKPLTPEQRLRKQQRFLKAYGEHGVVKYACKFAGISRQTYKNWRDNDKEFQAQLPDVKEDAHDTLEFAAYTQAVDGVDEPAISMGQVVYEYEPELDENGEQVYDNRGKPVMKRGNMVTIKKYSPQVLITLLKANMPEKYRERTQMELSGSIDVTGARDLLERKLQALGDRGESTQE
jgi:hypothetical protein